MKEEGAGAESPQLSRPLAPIGSRWGDAFLRRQSDFAATGTR